MRKIIFIPLLATLFITACKKEAIESKAQTTFGNTINAPVPCTGNTWGDDQLFKGGDLTLPLVYNNKAYVFKHDVDRLLIFDGTSWDSISMLIPFTNNPEFVFTIGNKGYLGFNHWDNIYPDFFWEYDFVAKTWSSKPIFPGRAESEISTFTIGNKAYLVGGWRYAGWGYASTKETWEYNQATSSWTQKADLPFISITGATGFSIGNKGYVVNGSFNIEFVSSVYLSDLYEYNPVTDAWSFKTPFPGGTQKKTNVFVIGGAAYAGGGTNGTGAGAGLPLYYKYSPATDAWVSIASFPASNNPRCSFSINSRGYVVYKIGGSGASVPLHMYKYTPKICSLQGPSQ